MKNPSSPAETANWNAAFEPLIERPELIFSNLTVSQIDVSYVEISLPLHASVKQSKAASNMTGSPLATCAGWSPEVVSTCQRPAGICACASHAKMRISAATMKQYFTRLAEFISEYLVV
jgi:hypothetical protein